MKCLFVLPYYIQNAGGEFSKRRKMAYHSHSYLELTLLAALLLCYHLGPVWAGSDSDLSFGDFGFVNSKKSSVWPIPAPEPVVKELKEIQKSLNLDYFEIRPKRWRSGSTSPLCNPRDGSLANVTNPSLARCSLPVHELSSGRPLAGNVFHESFPSWINLTLARHGQAFARKNRVPITIAAACGLVVGLAAPDARDILSFTRNSDTIGTATPRYIATGAQMYVWFDEKFSGNQDDNVILKSIANVRSMHLRVVHRASTAPRPLVPKHKYSHVKTDDEMWEAVQKDLYASPLAKYSDWPANYTKYDSTAVPMNQFIQGLTVLGFMGYVILDPEAVYIWDATEHELKGFMHLWAIIAYMMGVEDDYNLNLQPTVADAAKFVWDSQNLYSLPGFMRHMDKTTKVMMEALAIGLDTQGLNLGLRRVMYLILVNLFKIPAHHLRATFSPADELAHTEWEALFIPATRFPSSRVWGNEAFKIGFDSARAVHFGVQMTQSDIAENVFYPNKEMRREN